MKVNDYLEKLKRQREEMAKGVRLPVSGPEQDPKPSGVVFPDGKPAWWDPADPQPKLAPLVDSQAIVNGVREKMRRAGNHRGLRLVWSAGREV